MMNFSCCSNSWDHRWQPTQFNAFFSVLCLVCVFGSLSLSAAHSGSKELPRLHVGLGHTKEVTACAFGPRRRILATGSEDKTVRIWDLKTGRERTVLTGAQGKITTLALSSDGKLVYAGTGQGNVHVWKAIDGGKVHSFNFKSGEITCVAIDAEDHFLAVGFDKASPSRIRFGHTRRGAEGGLTIVNLSNNKVEKHLKPHPSAAQCVSFDPRGRLLASGARDGKIRVWDPTNGRLIREFKAHKGGVSGVEFSPKGKLVVSGGRDGRVRLWRVNDGQEIQSFERKGFYISQVGASSAGASDKTLSVLRPGDLILDVVGQGSLTLKDIGEAAASSDSSSESLWGNSSGDKGVLEQKGIDKVRLLVLRNGKRSEVSVTREEIKSVDTKELARIDALAFSPDGRYVAAASKNGALQLWETASGDEVLRMSGRGADDASVAFTSTGRLFSSVASGPIVKMSKNRERKKWIELGSKLPGLVSADLSPDGKILATGHSDQIVRLWDLDAGRLVRILEGHSAEVQAVAFSPDGQTIASTTYGEEIKLWHVQTGRERWTYTIEGNVRMKTVVFTPDGKYVTAPGKLVDVDTGQAEKKLEISTKGRRGGRHGPVRGWVCMSPNGWLLSTWYRHAMWRIPIQLLDIESGRLVNTINRFQGNVLSADFSSDGHYLAYGTSASRLFLYDVRKHESAGFIPLKKNYDGRVGMGKDTEAAVQSVRFAPDSKHLATGSADASIRLWKIDSRKCVQTLRGHAAGIVSVHYGPEGEIIISTSTDGTAKVWQVKDGALLATFAAGARGTDDFLAWTPEGYFVGTARGQDVVSVRKESGVYPLGQYRENFYRPDIVAERLAGNLPRETEVLRAMDPPSVRIMSPDRSVSIDQDTIQVIVKAEDAKHGINKSVISVNGKVADTYSAEGDKQVNHPCTIQLVSGENILSAYAVSTVGARSPVHESRVTFEPPDPEDMLKPDLWVLGIGVSNYKREDYNLDYPVADVTRIGNVLRQRSSDIFDKIHVKSLCDKDATRPRIMDAREKFLSRASVRDVIVIWLAGHGVRDRRGNFYFLCYDADKRNPHRHGLSWHDIQNQLLADLPAQKVLGFVDTCYSGAVGLDSVKTRSPGGQREAQLDLLADRLKEATGCYLFMSAMNRETALESSSWGGGAFGVAVAEGIRGKGATKGPVTILSLVDYVDRRVIELTKGSQHPVIKIPQNARNFPIAVLSTKE